MEVYPFVSIVIPVRNAASNIGRCLESIKQMDYPADKYEVILADGGSTDETISIGGRYNNVIILDNPKKTVAPGRNIGFEKSKGGLIAFTDADCVVDRNWVKNSIKYFNDEKIAGVGGPNYTPKDETTFGKAVGLFFEQQLVTAGSIHAANLPYIKEVKALPGCNAIYRRRILNMVMPTDETLLTCDDVDLNTRILKLGYKLFNVPDVFVYHYRRPTVARLAHQIYRYAIGRLQLARKNKDMLNPIHISVGLTIPIFLILLPLIYIYEIEKFVLLTMLFFVTLFFMYFLIKSKSIPITAYTVPVLLIVIFSWSLGFMHGLIKHLDIKNGPS